MKKLGLFGIILLCTFALISCSSSKYYGTQANPNLSEENWMQTINLNHKLWTSNVDPWYHKRERDPITYQRIYDPIAQEMIQVQQKIPFFTNISINGNYRIQIVGHQERNSVQFSGTKTAKRLLSLDIRNQTLYIQPAPECIKNSTERCKGDNTQVTIRIGINNLRSIINVGNSSITGKYITSDALTIRSVGNSNILLNGRMKLTEVNNFGCGTITILGAYSSCVDINVTQCGTVNIAGRVGLHAISNADKGNINVIGGYSGDTIINAKGASTTKIGGMVNLKSINTYDNSHVYLYWVKSNNVTVRESGNSCVGLAGYTTNLSVETFGSSGFQGKCLRTWSTYIRTHGSSHANISADKKVFAEANGNSSIYYYGRPSVISRFLSQNGAIIPVWTNEIPTPPVSGTEPAMFNFNRGG